MTDPTPAHIEATTETTTRYRCHQCGARIILGTYGTRCRTEDLLTDWLSRHRHGAEEPPS